MWKKIKSIFGKTESQIQEQETGFIETIDVVAASPSDSIASEESITTEPKEIVRKERPRYELSIADAVAGIIYDLGFDFMKSDRLVNAMSDYGAFQNQRASATICKTLSNENLLSKLWTLTSPNNLDNILATIKQQAVATYGFSDILVESILWEIVLGLGLIDESEAKSKISRLMQPKHQLPTNKSTSSISRSPVTPTGPYNPDYCIVGYKLPKIDVFSVSHNSIDMESILIEGKKRIELVLQGQRIPANVITVYGGPRVSLYEIEIDLRKASRVSRMEREILSALSPVGSRIINPLPGKLAIGIELPNSSDSYNLSTRDVFDNDTFLNCDYELPIALGIDSAGNAIVKDLSQIPHLFICGDMQQGKTTLLRQIIASLLLKKNPERIKFTFIDTSSLDLMEFKKLSPYWMAQDSDNSSHSVIYNSNDGMKILNDLVIELESRCTLFQDAGVRDIKEYNKTFCDRKLNPQKGHKYLPYIIVICDEIAPLQAYGLKAFDSLLAALLPKAAITGIHCIFTTKYTSTDTLTPVVRANFPARIAFRIHLPNESKLVTGNHQATALLPNGDIILTENGSLLRCQVSKCEVSEINSLVEEIAKNNLPDYPYLFPETALDLLPLQQDTRDPLMEEVARELVLVGTASTSAIQRRYCIGYNRAGKILDELEAYGIVGPASGGKPRSVLVDSLTLESILSSL